MRRRIKLALALSAALALTAIVVGCGSSSGGDSTHPNYEKALAGAPAPLAKLYGEANQLLPGGRGALERRIAALGYPIVVNVWASWCGPCRFEFPMFQKMSAKFGKQVAFIGIDSEDSEKEAESWLKGNPVPYPSYYESGSDYASSLKATGPPDTAFYNAKGELVGKKFGQYPSVTALEEDIERYALGGA